MSKTYKIAVIAGDGIGKEVIPAGIAAIEAATNTNAVKTSGKTYDDSIADGRYAPALVAYRSEVARAKGAGSSPRKYGTNCIIPELVNMGAVG